MLYTYKAINCEMVKQNISARNLRSADNMQLVVPKAKTATYGDRNFIRAAPVLWNQLPLDLRNSTSLNTFKRNLKTRLFKAAYSVVN